MIQEPMTLSKPRKPKANDELTARLSLEAARRGWTVRRARREIRLLMAEAECDSFAAMKKLEEGQTAGKR